MYRGYFDDVHNTDNAWMEVDVINVHFEKPLADRPLEVFNSSAYIILNSYVHSLFILIIHNCIKLYLNR